MVSSHGIFPALVYESSIMKSSRSVGEVARSHRSIRSYKSDPLPKGMLEELIECGLRSSTSGNLISWSVVAVEDAGLREQLYKLHFEQEMILQAPLVLTFCVDHHRTWTWLEARKAKKSFDDLLGFLKGAFDAVIAAQSIALAAESKGLGICYMGTTLWSATEIVKLLKLPKGVFPVTSLVVGWPNEAPDLRERLDLNSVLHHNVYKSWTQEAVLDLYKEKEISGWKRIRSFPGVVEAMTKEGITDLANYYTSEAKYGKGKHLKFSKALLELLNSQDLWNHQ